MHTCNTSLQYKLPTVGLAQLISNCVILSLKATSICLFCLLQDFIELIYIKEVSLFFSVSSSEPTPPTSSFSFSLPIRHPVENCSCPDAYDGLSCESCARGYARPSGSITDPCVRCECNGQTLDCDVGTTICLNCGGNTTGNNCEHCQVGFYGDPTRGIPCVPCDCPLVENSFSPTCFLNVTDGFSTCDACAEGYIGRNCEECVDGYFGNPMVRHNRILLMS